MRFGHRGFALLLGGVLCLCAVLFSRGAASAPPLVLTLVITPSFGVFLGGPSGRQFVLNTNDTVGGTDAGDHIRDAVSGELDVTRNGTPDPVNIVADNISTLGGLTVNQILCSYDGGAQQACDGAGITVTSGTNKVLRVGLDITTSQTHSATDSPTISMDITVSFI